MQGTGEWIGRTAGKVGRPSPAGVAQNVQIDERVVDLFVAWVS
jgi:hypothetical protein